jgi:fimbrial isopeptide formation D2 family protein/LPXTG-motif cell wall-anchored protein
MKGKIRKLLSVVVATAMTLSCLSVPAFADNEGGGTSEDTTTSSERAHTYELYQIFTATPSGEGANVTLSAFKWGKNGKFSEDDTATKVGDPVKDTVINDIKSAMDLSSLTEKLNIVTKYVDFSTEPYRGTDQQPTRLTNGRDYEYTGLEPGYYIIKDKDGTQNGKDGFYTLYLVDSTSGTLTVSPKGNVPEVDKGVAKTSDGTPVDNVAASINDTLYYTIEGYVSTRIFEFQTYYYSFTDTLSAGLDYGFDAKVYLNSVADDNDITQYFYISPANTDTEKANVNKDGHSSTTIKIAIQDLKQLQNITGKNYTIDQKTKIIVKYTATLNQHAVVKDANTNTVSLEYFNDPNNSGVASDEPPTTNPTEPDSGTTPTGESVDETANVFTTEISIIKRAKNGGYILPGAEFTLTSTDGATKVVAVTEDSYVLATDEESKDSNVEKYLRITDSGQYVKESEKDSSNLSQYDDNGMTKYVYKSVTVLKGEKQSATVISGVTDSNGVLIFYGLDAGTYTLTESNPPTGYKAMEDIPFTVTFDATTGQFRSSYGDMINTSNGNYDGILHLAVLDELDQTTLPETGGIGTTIFYVAGTILVLGAAVALITRRRMKGEVK